MISKKIGSEEGRLQLTLAGLGPRRGSPLSPLMGGRTSPFPSRSGGAWPRGAIRSPKCLCQRQMEAYLHYCVRPFPDGRASDVFLDAVGSRSGPVTPNGHHRWRRPPPNGLPDDHRRPMGTPVGGEWAPVAPQTGPQRSLRSGKAAERGAGHNSWKPMCTRGTQMRSQGSLRSGKATARGAQSIPTHRPIYFLLCLIISFCSHGYFAPTRLNQYTFRHNLFLFLKMEPKRAHVIA